MNFQFLKNIKEYTKPSLIKVIIEHEHEMLYDFASLQLQNFNTNTKYKGQTALIYILKKQSIHNLKWFTDEQWDYLVRHSDLNSVDSLGLNTVMAAAFWATDTPKLNCEQWLHILENTHNFEDKVHGTVLCGVLSQSKITQSIKVLTRMFEKTSLNYDTNTDNEAYLFIKALNNKNFALSEEEVKTLVNNVIQIKQFRVQLFQNLNDYCEREKMDAQQNYSVFVKKLFDYIEDKSTFFNYINKNFYPHLYEWNRLSTFKERKEISLKIKPQTSVIPKKGHKL